MQNRKKPLYIFIGLMVLVILLSAALLVSAVADSVSSAQVRASVPISSVRALEGPEPRPADESAAVVKAHEDAAFVAYVHWRNAEDLRIYAEAVAEAERQEAARRAAQARREAEERGRAREAAAAAPSAPPAARSGVNWDAIAQCESGGNWSINTGNGYYGGLQFALSSWQAVGGTGYPHQHSKAEQIYRAELLSNHGRNLGHWPTCGKYG